MDVTNKEAEAFDQTVKIFDEGTNDEFREVLYNLDRPVVFVEWVSKNHPTFYYKILHRITTNHLVEVSHDI